MWRDSSGPRPRAAGRSTVAALILASVWATAGSLTAQDLIVLRDTNLIRDRTVSSWSVDGLLLDDGTLVGWDTIESARVSAKLQADVNRALEELGGPLFRIRQRLQVGDYAGVLAPAQSVHRRFLTRASATGLMVSQALMWGHLEAGHREHALLAHLECVAKLRARPRLAESLPGARRPRIDLETGLSPELTPVFFDRSAAAEIQPAVLGLAAKLPAPRPAGVYFYCAALCEAAGDQEMAERMIAAVQADRGSHWRLILQVQRQGSGGADTAAATRLEQTLGQLDRDDVPLALYWLNRARLAGPPPPDDSVALALVSIAALYGESHPELAAAALHHTMDYFAAQDRPDAAIRVRRELLERYGRTHFGRQAAEGQEQEDATEADDTTAERTAND